MAADNQLKNIKDDTFMNIPKFLEEIQEKESLHSETWQIPVFNYI